MGVWCRFNDGAFSKNKTN